jgi:hypothetical protein
MTDIFQGVAAPDVNTTKTLSTTTDPTYTSYLQDLAKAGTTAMGTPANKLVAGMTDMQNQGYSAIPAAATSYKPGLSAAEQSAANASGVNETDINQFMNPFTTNVVNRMGQLSDQNTQRNILPQLRGNFVSTGGLGGQRFANAAGQSLADINSNLIGQQYGALSTGYSDAVKNAISNAQLENQAAQTQGVLAGKEQELGLTGAGALTKAGEEQQKFNQSIIDAPLKNATNAAQLLKGYTVPTSTTETFKGPIAGTYSNSPLSQIAGLGTLLASGTNKDKTGWLDKWLASGSTTGKAATGTAESGGNTDNAASSDALSSDAGSRAALYAGYDYSGNGVYKDPDTGKQYTYNAGSNDFDPVE